MARIEAVSAAIGKQRLNELMLILADRVQNIASAAKIFPEAAEDFLASLHQTRGSAASLGFLALAEELARMEAMGRAAERDIAAVRRAARALPGIWHDAEQAKQALLF